MKIFRLLSFVCLLFNLLVLNGCQDHTPPPAKSASVKVEGILNDTADDLELGAKVRMLVEQQDRERNKVVLHTEQPAELQNRRRHHYPLNALIFGMTFIIWVAILLDVAKGGPNEKAT